MGREREEKAFSDYDNIVDFSKQNIPDFWISTYKTDSRINKIYTNGQYESSVSIVLCNDKEDENAPLFENETAISYDFDAKYPVLYIKFFVTERIEDVDEKTEDYIYDIPKYKYKPATLVFPSDNTSYILIDGAFYTIERRE